MRLKNYWNKLRNLIGENMKDDTEEPIINIYDKRNKNVRLFPIMLGDGGKMQMWHSICSAHQGWDVMCDNCSAGSWVEIAYVED